MATAFKNERTDFVAAALAFKEQFQHFPPSTPTDIVWMVRSMALKINSLTLAGGANLVTMQVKVVDPIETLLWQKVLGNFTGPISLPLGISIPPYLNADDGIKLRVEADTGNFTTNITTAIYYVDIRQPT